MPIDTLTIAHSGLLDARGNRLPAGDPDALDGQARALAWVKRLTSRLEQRRPAIERLRHYHEGQQPLMFATKAWREKFGPTFGQIVDNFCELVVDAATERMTVQGFRFGDRDTSKRAWDIWQANQLDLESDIAHTDAMVGAYSYVLVWPDEDGRPVITLEDALQSIVQRDPRNRRRRLAGLKTWRELGGQHRAMLWTPDLVWELEGGKDDDAKWSVTSETPNPLGRVPLVELINKPNRKWLGGSDLEPILTLQDVLNKTWGDLMVGSEFASYRQRVLLGQEVATKRDAEGNDIPVPQIEVGIERWLAFEGSGDQIPKIQELSAADLGPHLKTIELAVQHMAAITRTPPHYLLGQLVNVSADALRAAEAGLVSRVKRRRKFFSEAWEEIVLLAMIVDGYKPTADDLSAETLWADPETISEATRADFLSKLSAINVPDEMLWRRAGFSEQEVDEMATMRERAARLDGLSLGIAGADGLPPDLEREPAHA